MAGDFSASCGTHNEARLPETRIVVLGDACVGKTALLRQYLDHESPSSSSVHEPTLLDTYTHVDYCGTQAHRLIFTDCCSAPSFREHRAAYLAKCDVVLLVYSAQHHQSLLNLRHWMQEVVEARGAAGPARFASTAGDFSEVPIFVIGTHYGEKTATEPVQPAAADEAESITTECLHCAGYFLDEEDADAEEKHRVAAAAQVEREQRRCAKAKRSPRAFSGFFSRLFHSAPTATAEEATGAAAQKRKAPCYAAAGQHPSPVSASQRQFPSSPATAASPPLASLLLDSKDDSVAADDARFCGTSSALSVPPGASARLPLYRLSNADGDAVDMAVRASLSLHVWLQQHESAEMALSTAPTPRCSTGGGPHDPLRRSVRSAGDAAEGGGVELPSGLPPVVAHARTVSTASHASHASERSAVSFMPPMLALYSSTGLSGSLGGGSTESPTLRHSSGISCAGPSATTTGSFPLCAPPPPPPPSTHGATGDSGSAAAAVAEGNAPHQDEANRESEWCSPASCSPCGGAKGDGSGNWSSWVESQPLALSNASPTELDATTSRGAPARDEAVTQVNTSIYFSPPNPRRATAPNTSLRDEKTTTCADHHPTGDMSPLSGTSRAVVMTGCEFSAISGPATHAGVASPTAAVTDATAAPSVPMSLLWRDVDAAEVGGSAGTDSCGSQSAKTTESVVKRLSLEYDGKLGLSSSAVSPHADDDGVARSSAARTSSVDTLTTPLHTCHDNSHAPFAVGSSLANDSVVLPHSPRASHTPASAPAAAAAKAQPSKAPLPPTRNATREPVTPASSVVAPRKAASLSHLSPPPRDATARSAHSGAPRLSGNHAASPTTPAKPPPVQSKQKSTQCNAGSCAVM